MIDIVAKIGSLLLVTISTSLAIIIYYRNKKVELENSLFKIRLEAIGIIEMEIVIFFQHLDRMKLFLVNPELIKEMDTQKMSLDMDDQMYKCQASVARYSAYFSESSKSSAYLFMENILGEIERNNINKIDVLNTYLDHQLVLAQIALEALKKEAGLIEVHDSLMRRFKRKHAYTSV